MWKLFVKSKSSARTVRPSTAQELRLLVADHLTHGRNDDALALIPKLRFMEPTDPRWPHKQGDLLRLNDRHGEAARAYAEAAKLYAEQGLPRRASAMAALAGTISPAHAPRMSIHPMVIGAVPGC